MKLVLDSTPLIYFAKLKALDKVALLKGEKIIPKSVYSEVVEEGKARGKEDALLIEGLIKKDLFKVLKGDSKLLRHLSEIRNISDADSEVLALAKEHNAIAVIDESYSRTVAGVEGIECRGSVFLLFSLYNANIIKKDDIKKYVDDMINLGWRCSTELYASIINEVEKL
jgi:predicted nucleic acid-binding protein